MMTVIIPEILNRLDPMIPGVRRIGPTPSPDEQIIQARGRRQMPLTFSPDVHLTPLRNRRVVAQSALLTGKNTPSPVNMGRLLLPTRTSPRKRLTLTDSPPERNSSTGNVSCFDTPSPDKVKRSPISKKCKIDKDLVGSGASSTLTLMKGLSNAQLIDIFAKIMEDHPEVEEEVAAALPAPDLAVLEEKLNYLKRNVFKALPSNRLESKTDSLAYNRVATHLLAFKKTLVDQGKQLTEAGQWASVVDYTVMAWSYVKATPVWDNPSHNNVRKQCFKSTAVNCLAALKKGSWSPQLAAEIKGRLAPLTKDSDDLAACVKYLDTIAGDGENEQEEDGMVNICSTDV